MTAASESNCTVHVIIVYHPVRKCKDPLVLLFKFLRSTQMVLITSYCTLSDKVVLSMAYVPTVRICRYFVPMGYIQVLGNERPSRPHGGRA